MCRSSWSVAGRFKAGPASASARVSFFGSVLSPAAATRSAWDVRSTFALPDSSSESEGRCGFAHGRLHFAPPEGGLARGPVVFTAHREQAEAHGDQAWPARRGRDLFSDRRGLRSRIAERTGGIRARTGPEVGPPEKRESTGPGRRIGARNAARVAAGIRVLVGSSFGDVRAGERARRRWHEEGGGWGRKAAGERSSARSSSRRTPRSGRRVEPRPFLNRRRLRLRFNYDTLFAKERSRMPIPRSRTLIPPRRIRDRG